MATVRLFVFTDDLDGSSDDVGTFRFAFEGVEYEIDLAPHNLVRMREMFAPYIAAGRRLPRWSSAQRRGYALRDDRSANAKVRAFWAAHQQRLELPPHRSHGAIPYKVRQAYLAAR